MAVKTSTGAANSILKIGLKDTFALGFIRVLSGSAPATADAAETGTLLCIISNDDTGTGLTFDDPIGRTINKAAAEIWRGTNLANGTPGYVRLVAVGDTGVSSTTQPRDQRECGVDIILNGGAALILGANTPVGTWGTTLRPTSMPCLKSERPSLKTLASNLARGRANRAQHPRPAGNPCLYRAAAAYL